MPTRNISLTQHQDRFVEQAIASGRYQNASEVLRDGLRLLERQEAEDAARLARLLAAIDEGEAAIARGDFIEVADDELENWLAGLGQTGRR